jgi:hypothetical protein
MGNTITSSEFTTFVAGTPAKSGEVNGNFSIYRGGYIPINTDTSSASDLTHDVGAPDHRFRHGYSGSFHSTPGITTVAGTIGNWHLSGITNGAGTPLFTMAGGASDTTILGANIVSAGGPIEVGFISKSGVGGVSSSVDVTLSGSSVQWVLVCYRDTTTSVVGAMRFGNDHNTTTSITERHPASGIKFIDTAVIGAAGTYRYSFVASNGSAGSTFNVRFTHFLVREIT